MKPRMSEKALICKYIDLHCLYSSSIAFLDSHDWEIGQGLWHPFKSWDPEAQKSVVPFPSLGRFLGQIGDSDPGLLPPQFRNLPGHWETRCCKAGGSFQRAEGLPPANIPSTATEVLQTHAQSQLRRGARCPLGPAFLLLSSMAIPTVDPTVILFSLKTLA